MKIKTIILYQKNLGLNVMQCKLISQHDVHSIGYATVYWTTEASLEIVTVTDISDIATFLSHWFRNPWRRLRNVQGCWTFPDKMSAERTVHQGSHSPVRKDNYMSPNSLAIYIGGSEINFAGIRSKRFSVYFDLRLDALFLELKGHQLLKVCCNWLKIIYGNGIVIRIGVH